MKQRTLLMIVAAVVSVAAGVGLYSLGVKHGAKMDMPAVSDTQSGAVDPATGKRVLYWHDPMVPGHKFDKPGKSPFMDMQLVPVYADDGTDEGQVSISPRMQQNLGIRTAEVTRGKLDAGFEAVGSVAYNERDVALVQARSNGFLEKLHVRAPLDPVKKGQPLAELYVPDWIAAQEEFLLARRLPGAQADGLLEAARQRLRLVGMDDAQIRTVEAAGKPRARIALTSPIDGVVSELAAREGMTVAPGMLLFRINGTRTVWVNAEVPENDAGRLRPGMSVAARSAAYPGETFKGKVGALLPEVRSETRTLKARVELDNRAGRLLPGMFVTVNFAAGAREEVLLVPTEAVIRTGTRNLVIVAQGEGKFAPVEVQLGDEAGGHTEIRQGLAAGQAIVVSGQFLIDSEASLKGVATRMEEGRNAADGTTHRGVATVESIDKDEIILSHGPIPSLEWGEMTMGFKPPASGMPPAIKEGDKVSFEFRQTADGQFEIVGIMRVAGADKGTSGATHSGAHR